MKTKLLFTHFSMENAGGAERALVALLKNLPPERYDVDLLMWDRKGYHYTQIPEHVNILEPLWQLAPGSRQVAPRLRSMGMEREAQVREEITRLNKSEGVDHSRNWEMMKTIVPSYAGYDIAVAYNTDTLLKVVADKVTAKKKIAWVHVDYSSFVENRKGSGSALMPNFLLPFFARMDTIVCVTPQNVQGFIACFPTLEGKIISLPNILDIEGILEQGEYPLPDEAWGEGMKLFTAGRLVQQKGIDIAIEAADLLRERGYRFSWNIAGAKSPGWEEYQRMIEDRLLGGVVRLLGELENPYPYFKNCDIYVHPSRFEGKPLALDEAKLFARPIVATRFSSVAESVVDKEQGVICDINTGALAAALMGMMDDAVLRARLYANLKSWRYDNGFSNYESLFSTK